MPENLTFDVTRDSGKLIIDFSSTMEFVDKAAEITKVFLRDAGLARYLFAIIVTLREGLTNAVRHAHKNDPDKITRLSLTIHNNKLIVVIKDQGPGFDWKTAKESATFENQSSAPRDHGMGFPIMEKYFEKFWYNAKGNKLTMIKYISP